MVKCRIPRHLSRRARTLRERPLEYRIVRTELCTKQRLLCGRTMSIRPGQLQVARQTKIGKLMLSVIGVRYSDSHWGWLLAVEGTGIEWNRQ
jgi:hypothetical protein